MTLFALKALMDRLDRYKDAAKLLIRQRHQTLYHHVGVPSELHPNDVDYYTLIDLDELAGALHGTGFQQWFSTANLGVEFLLRLSRETGVVLLPGEGFEVAGTSARVPLANLTDHEYVAIGTSTRRIIDEYFHDYELTVAR